MSLRILFSLCVVAASSSAFSAEASHKIGAAGKLPDGFSKKVSAAVLQKGIQLAGPKGPVIEIWFAKELALKPGFAPTLSVNYAFTPGQFVGVLRVLAKSDYTDFRGQEIGAGVYTLRYGQQPEDGNHIGTSELADFLLALPAKVDTDPKATFDFDKLSMTSAKSVGSTHPAIFSLLPAPKKVAEKTQVTHDEDHEFWIISAPVNGTLKGKASKVGLRFVAIGRSEE